MDVAIRDKRPIPARLVLPAAVLTASLFVAPATAHAAQPEEELPREVRVAETFNDDPFTYRIESRKRASGYTIYRLTYPSPVVTPVAQNNTVPAEYYVPDGIGPGDPKRPAVICMHILDGDFVLVRMTCSMLASHGIPAIMFKLPYYEERGLPDGPRALADNPDLFVGALSQGLKDVRRTVDLLASRPEVDPERIGITGISLGGIVAAVSAGVEPRLHRAMLILAGGDLNTIIHHAYETAELSEVIRALPPDERAEIDRAIDAVDPLRHAARLRDRAQAGRVLMINAAVDEVIPPSCTRKLAAALGMEDRVVWLEGLGHYTAMAELPRVLRTAVAFFGEDMPEGAKTPDRPPRRRAPLEIIAALVQQLATFLVAEPREGRCHFIDFSVSVTPEDDDPIEAWLRVIRGRNGRFKLEGDLPVVGKTALGQNDDPWMVSGGKMLFRGTGESHGESHGESDDPFAYVDPQNLMKLRMAAGAAAGIGIAPHVLSQWIEAERVPTADGPPAIEITFKEDEPGSLRLVLRDDGKTPRRVTFDVGGAQGTVTFRGWQMNTVAHPAMFDPPAGLAEREVSRADLQRVFSSMFDFAVETSQ